VAKERQDPQPGGISEPPEVLREKIDVRRLGRQPEGSFHAGAHPVPPFYAVNATTPVGAEGDAGCAMIGAKVIFRQFIHDDLGCASYVLGDEDAGVAAVVDPRLAIEEYLEFARYVGVQIEHVLETHTHADHVSGHGRLRAATGATIHIHRDAAAAYEHEPFDDGWELELGDVRVRALHTPGHRPEHTAFLLIDSARGDDPWAVLTGDTLFVGDVARPDLAIDKDEGARGIFRSLNQRLFALAPETEVWPGHLGGSMCGGPGMDMKTSSTIGFERRHNPLLGEADEDRFVELMLAELGPQPPNFRRIVEINRGAEGGMARTPEPLSPRQVEERRRAGALLVDVRTHEQFDDAHVPDSICVSALHAGFGTKLAWLGAAAGEIVFVGRDDDDARVAAGLAGAIGITAPTSYLSGGMTSWRLERRDVARIARLDPEGLFRRAQDEPDVQILDVREESEWRLQHIPGSVHVPYHDIEAVPEGLDSERPIAVICSSGQRSAVAASVIQRLGARQVVHVVDGGVGTWARAGHPIERGELSSPLRSA
jgi:glyoxylase-like metal-dependent hydrolase (beta-lactamase superfamily II)/rhodanese-related sulfurtransferase